MNKTGTQVKNPVERHISIAEIKEPKATLKVLWYDINQIRTDPEMVNVKMSS